MAVLTLAIQEKREESLRKLTNLVCKLRQDAPESELLWLGLQLMKLSQQTCEIVHRRREPLEPTTANVGSSEKLEVMSERYFAGESLYHADDNILISDLQQIDPMDEEW